MTEKRVLILHMPVFHTGYLRFFKKHKSSIQSIYLVDKKFLKTMPDYVEDISALDVVTVQKILKYFGFPKVFLLSKNTTKSLANKKLLFIDDQYSREIQSTYFPKADCRLASVFLRWDRTKVLSQENVSSPASGSRQDVVFIKRAYVEAKKSSDWWRQVGAVLVRGEKMIFSAYNEGVPSDHTPYEYGALRDMLKVGEHPEISSTIHAEQKIVASAAKKGLSLLGTELYVTHFPCSVCAKLIAFSGIQTCYFTEGSSNADGSLVFSSLGVKVLRVKF